MKGYWVARVDVSDAEVYGKYAILATKAIEEHGGRFLARGGKFISKEGDARSRNVLVEFDSLANAEKCYNSDTYEEALKFANASSVRDFLILEGI